mgnify:CR=1 FL=1
MISNTLSRITTILLSISLMTFAASALAAGEHGHGHDSGHGNGGHDEGGHSSAFGSPVSPSKADRTVEVEASDRMKFGPEKISVKKGETIRFVVKNVGQLQHSFTLATPDKQQKHEKEMQGMAQDRMGSHMDEDPNGVVVPSGETGSLTWRFTKAVPVEFACHIPGHYDAGMKGRLRIK